MSERIQALQENLDFSKARYEHRNAQEKFAVIPVKEAFKSQNNRDKNPFNYLVVALDAQPALTKGNLIQYIPDRERMPAPQNTFAKIYNYGKLDCSGKFTILSVADDFQFELTFEKGGLKTFSEKRSKQKGNSGGRTTSCTDWYYQTWAVWSDGSMELISETYAFTTCDDDCWLAKTINGRTFRVECSGGGGGGNILYEIIEELAARPGDFIVGTGSIWYVKAYVSMTGRKVNGIPRFTGISYSSSTIFQGAGVNAVWTKTNATTEYSYSTASCAVQGKVVFEQGPDAELSRIGTWQANNVFQ
ncbi:MAG: hypothetical protein JWP88_125 [Flaviaesturariibacter sp.]|nr:hypothetical protein [Flaviaesturariibacter sp.]